MRNLYFLSSMPNNQKYVERNKKHIHLDHEEIHFAIPVSFHDAWIITQQYICHQIYEQVNGVDHSEIPVCSNPIFLHWRDKEQKCPYFSSWVALAERIGEKAASEIFKTCHMHPGTDYNINYCYIYSHNTWVPIRKESKFCDCYPWAAPFSRGQTLLQEEALHQDMSEEGQVPPGRGAGV